MPEFIAKHICPDLIIVPLNYSRYQEASREAREVFVEYDINFDTVGLDEAYLNITKYCQHCNITPTKVIIIIILNYLK